MYSDPMLAIFLSRMDARRAEERIARQTEECDGDLPTDGEGGAEGAGDPRCRSEIPSGVRVEFGRRRS